MKRFLLIRGTELLALLLLAAIPLFITNPFVLGLLTLLAIYGILLIGLDVTVGYLGQVNLAQAAFLGIGAYTAGLLVTQGGYSILFGLACAFVICLVIGAVLALPALRLEGPQFALATLSFGALAVTILNEWEDLTLGAQGLSVSAARPSSATNWTQPGSTGCAWHCWHWCGWACATCSPRNGAAPSKRCATARLQRTPWASAPIATR